MKFLSRGAAPAVGDFGRPLQTTRQGSLHPYQHRLCGTNSISVASTGNCRRGFVQSCPLGSPQSSESRSMLVVIHASAHSLHRKYLEVDCADGGELLDHRFSARHGSTKEGDALMADRMRQRHERLPKTAPDQARFELGGFANGLEAWRILAHLCARRQWTVVLFCLVVDCLFECHYSIFPPKRG